VNVGATSSVAAERFVEEVRGDEPELATSLRIEERELEAGGGAADYWVLQ